MACRASTNGRALPNDSRRFSVHGSLRVVGYDPTVLTHHSVSGVEALGKLVGEVIQVLAPKENQVVTILVRLDS
jgi:hypothetical protein